ncbi:MAG: adenylate/guanylate cyclase domain-containing protein [Actinomycetota bacterium]
MSAPLIEYAESDGLRIAYQVVGDGPLDLVLVTEWATPLEERWNVPAIAGRLERLASFSRVISFDKRGIGLSDRGGADDMFTPEVWVRDLVAVMDAAGAARPVLFGAHEGGPITVLCAASLPERVEALVLANTGPRLLTDHDYPHGFEPSRWRPDLDGILALWQSGAAGEEHIAVAATDPWWRDWYGRSRRQQASPAAGLRLMEMLGGIDVRRFVPAITAPTLIVHRRDNSWWPVGHAEWMAEAIEGAELAVLDGRDNYWWAGDADVLVDAVERFLLGERRSSPSQRELATIVFTDIVDSTQRASDAGDRAWRSVLDAHDSTTRRVVERHGGRVLKQLGDGMLLTFDGPARAIRGVRAVQDELGQLGLQIRSAVHTGEVERRSDDDIGGVAVHLAARVMALADAGEILVTGVVKGLVAGSELRFADRGRHRLKGIDDEWEIHAVVG